MTIDEYLVSYVGKQIGNSYGAGSGHIWLDDVLCIGTEKSITDCSHDPWGDSRCTHSNDVSVSCDTGRTLLKTLFYVTGMLNMI